MLLLLCSDTPVDHLSIAATFSFIIHVSACVMILVLVSANNLRSVGPLKVLLCHGRSSKAEQAEAAKIVPPGQDFLQKVKVGHLQTLFIIEVSVETAVTAAATM